MYFVYYIQGKLLLLMSLCLAQDFPSEEMQDVLFMAGDPLGPGAPVQC